MDTINIVVIPDENFARHAGVMFVSVLENKKSNNPVAFHVLGDNLSVKSRANLEQTVKKYGAEIYFYDVDTERIRRLPTIRHFNHATYMRLMLAEILPAELKKVLYLDVDMVVLQDITELWNIDISNYHIGAAEDLGMLQPEATEGIGLQTHFFNLGMPAESYYFNAGVILIDLVKWRQDNIGIKALELIETNPDKIIWLDQDALNSVLCGKVCPINREWNVFEFFRTRYYQGSEAKIPVRFIASFKNPAIVHFTGIYKPKPWDYLIYPDSYAKYYYKYLELTPWQSRLSKDSLKKRSIFLFGAGTCGKESLEFFKSIDCKVEAFLDNNSSKHGQYLDQVKIYPPEYFFNYAESENKPFIIITSLHVRTIRTQLEEMGLVYEEDFIDVP
jgi:lipopolysaccharide biosynthesis glycosyltransferase